MRLMPTLVAMYMGGGQGIAAIVERLQSGFLGCGATYFVVHQVHLAGASTNF